MTSEVTQELLPCPFCGGKAERLTLPEDSFGNGGGDVITCSRCQASSHVEFGRKENLVDRWNTRLTAQSGEGRAAIIEECARIADGWNPGRTDRVTETGIAAAIRELSGNTRESVSPPTQRMAETLGAQFVMSGEGRSGAGEDAVTVGLAEQVAEAMEDDGGAWRSCTGCHETNEGYSTGHFPYSAALKCELGSGCRECGGIGAVWDNTDYADMADFMAAADRDHANIKRILIENDIQPYRAEQIAMAITELEIPAALNARQPGEGEREALREALAEAYRKGATDVHNYWVNNPGEPPRGDPEFGESASDYAAAALDIFDSAAALRATDDAGGA